MATGTNTLSDSLGQSGGAIEWTCSKGDKYKFSLLTLEKQSQFERAIERKALEKIRSIKDLVDKDEYDKTVRETLKSISLGDYCFGKDRCTEELKTMWGVSTLLSILAGIDLDKANDLMNGNSEIGQLVETIVERSFPVMVERAREGKAEQSSQTGLS